MRLRQLFLINMIVILLCTLMVGFSWLINRNALEGTALSVFEAQGRAAFAVIRAARHWNAATDGVYVPVTPEIQPNPYLDVPHREITDNLGRELTRINPAYMTRQISEVLAGSDVGMRITSLKPLNYKNKPDDWEREFLLSMEQTGELERVERVGDRYRYMAGLNIVHSCLPCHEKYGYKVGDLRGGISFSRDNEHMERLIAPMLKRVDQMHLWVWGVLVLSACTLASLALRFWVRLLGSQSIQQRLKTLVDTDYLTGVLSRRELMRRLKQEVDRVQRFGTPLAVLMIDIDHFKRVNDQYGHAKGDQVLVDIAQALKLELRKVDSIGRYGGEEFTVILPNTHPADAQGLAERLLDKVRSLRIRIEADQSIRVTVSIGLANTGDMAQPVQAESLLAASDLALYSAKSSGRDRLGVHGRTPNS